jgi:hypothetical protein
MTYPVHWTYNESEKSDEGGQETGPRRFDLVMGNKAARNATGGPLRPSF